MRASSAATVSGSPTSGNVPCPALVIRGERDRIVSQAWAERVAAALPAGRLEVVRGSPHATHWAAAGEVARLVEEFA